VQSAHLPLALGWRPNIPEGASVIGYERALCPMARPRRSGGGPT